jgi:hypothetical protein
MNQDINIVAKMESDIAIVQMLREALNSGRIEKNEIAVVQDIQNRYAEGTATNEDDMYIQNTYFGQ